DGHGWWLEVWVTADPEPAPYHGAPTVGSFPRTAVGFQIAPVTTECFRDEPECNQPARIIITRNYQILRDTNLPTAKMLKTRDSHPNRFKLLINKDHAEFWASDWDTPGQLRQIVSVDNLGLDFSVGYVHLQHTQYNAPKAQASSSQTY